MIILQINSVYNYGSTGRIVKSLHHALYVHHEQSYVIYGRTSAFGKVKPIDNMDENVFLCQNLIEQKADIIHSIIFDKHGLNSRKNTKNIISMIEKIKPDIVHLHNIHGFYINYPMLLQYLKDNHIQIVWTLHDCWAYTGYCAYYDYHECDQWLYGCKKCQYKDGYPYRILSNSIQNLKLKKELYQELAVTLVTPSQWLKEEVEKSILKDKTCLVIHNDVDLSNFYRENSQLKTVFHLENMVIYMACANVWTKQKGLDEYIAFSKLLNEDEILVMIGMDSAKAKKLSDHMLGIQNIGTDDLRKWYSLCDCFINLTLEDNYPTVNLEARACGAHIVTYQTGGSAESAGPYAKIVPKHDVYRALEEARKCLDMKHIEDNVINHMTEQYIDLYHLLYQGGN